MREEFAVGNVREFVAARSLVHVMSADENGDPVGSQDLKFIPEIAPGFGIDTGCGFV